jgi:hypothetical protein
MGLYAEVVLPDTFGRGGNAVRLSVQGSQAKISQACRPLAAVFFGRSLVSYPAKRIPHLHYVALKLYGFGQRRNWLVFHVFSLPRAWQSKMRAVRMAALIASIWKPLSLHTLMNRSRLNCLLAIRCLALIGHHR